MHVKRNLLNIVVTSTAVLVGASALGQSSAYFQAMTNLNPVAYFPLQETAQPPIGDVETNLGTLGPVANAVYSGQWATKGLPGAIAGEADTAVDFVSSQPGGFLAVPHTDPRTTITNNAFSVEAWVYPANYNNFVGIVCQAGGNPGSLNGTSSTPDAQGLYPQGGWCLSAQYIAYLDSANLRGFSFHVYNGHSLSGNGAPRNGAEVAVSYNYQLNTWYHLVATFDGTNAGLYINGSNMTSAAVVHLPMPAGTAFLPDSWDPLCIGCSRNLNGNPYGGGVDEVAIYTNVLTSGQVATHYNTGINPSPSTPYEKVITNDQAYMYWRMDSLGYNAPDPSTYPTAAYYSANGTTMNVASGSLGTNSVYGTATQPGVSGPQFPGLFDPSFGNHSYGVAINGIGGNNGDVFNVNIGNGVSLAEAIPVDIGYNTLIDPNHPPLSVTAWFRGNPSDANGSQRFQTIFGHSDSSWRCAMSQTGHVQFNPGAGGDLVSTRVYNDGKWHQMVGVCNASGTNAGTNFLYIDGVLDNSATFTTLTFSTSPQDAIIGGDPEYLNSGNGVYGSTPNSTGTYTQRNFAGSVAHFAFFTNVLTPAQVSALYQTVGAPPVIVSQPFGPRTDGWAYNGTNTYLFFGVTASGSAPLSYQWYRTNASGTTLLVDDGVKYQGSTTFQVAVSNLVDADSGTYFVVITNNYGAVTSSVTGTAGAVTIYREPVVTAQSPAGGTLQYHAGQALTNTFSATVVGSTNDLVYQWFTNGVAMAGATATSLTVTSAQLAALGVSSITLQLYATNDFGSTSNLPVTVNVLPTPTPPTNSYGQALMALKPTGYWPMHEVEPPLPQLNIETNYGSAGTNANAYYTDWQGAIGGYPPSVLHQQTGALVNDPDPCVYFTGAGGNGAASGGSGALIPRTSPLTTIKAPFTLEAWVRPAINSFIHILSVGNLNANSGLNNSPNEGGFDWLWAGTANTFSITMRSGIGTASTEPKTTASYNPGVWYHVVTTFDGTNVAYYINGVQDPLQNSSAATMNPNTWAPLTIGGGRWDSSLHNQWQGDIDELAVYSNLMSPTDIQKHYNDGITGAAGVYKADVLADNPLLYYRMDSPTYTNPPISTWPALTNYGSSGVQGVYLPNAAPGSATGPAEFGFPSTGLISDGMSIYADAGYDPSFNLLGQTPMSVTAWFRGNPTDASERNWQTLVGHTDQNWRCAINGGTGAIGFDSGNGLDVRSTNVYNDGQWHQVVGTYDGSNTLVYVDGSLQGAGFKNSGQTTVAGSTFDVYLASSPNGQSNAFGGRTWAGQMCEAAYFYGTNFQPAQISALYNSAGVAPFIVVQPASTNADENAGFTNTVVAGGSAPFSYQWYKNGAPLTTSASIPSVTSASLVINPVTNTDASSNYYVVVSNADGAVTSAVVSLKVNTIPIIDQDLPFTNLNLFAGDHATFRIVVEGAHPLYYQWYSNNVAIAGATNAAYSLINAQVGGPTTYFCTVTNFLSSATSLTVTVTVTSPTVGYEDTVLADNPMAFWSLDECPDDGAGNQGVIANDYWGGYDGFYQNVYLCNLPGYNTNTDATEPAPIFGLYSLTDSDVIVSNIDFSTNGNATFSVEAWVNGFGTRQANGGPIICKGYGGGGEEFCLDCGSGLASGGLRWFIRYANGTAPNVSSTIVPQNGAQGLFGPWFHVVGVCDEVNSNIAMYVNGQLIGKTTVPINSGINSLSAGSPMTIAARSSALTVNHNDLQFSGEISQVALYNYALNSNQVLSHFNLAGITPFITQQPPSTVNVDENGTLTVSAAVIGTPPLSYQWINANTLAKLPTQTNATLVLSNYGVSSNGFAYELIVTNIYGSVASSPVNVNLNTGAPVIVQDLAPTLNVGVGSPFTLSVGVTGTEPFSYTWYENGSVIPNATNSSYSSAGVYGTNYFYAVVSNMDSPPVATSTVQTNIGVVGTLPITFPATGSSGWQLNHVDAGLPTLSNGVLTLVTAAGSESRSAFYTTKVSTAAFLVDFTYMDVTGGTAGADGITFCIQNSATTATGGGGGSLGVSGISPSVDFALNVYHGTTPPGPAAGWNLNGGNAATATAPVVLDNGSHPIHVTIYYNGAVATAWLTDLSTGQVSPVYTLNVNIPSFVANPAYIGFTGATGGSQAQQEVYNFSYLSVTTPKMSANLSGTNAVISWLSTASSLYQLQAATNLLGPWTVLGSGLSTVGGTNFYTVPPTGAAFFRLILPIQ